MNRFLNNNNIAVFALLEKKLEERKLGKPPQIQHLPSLDDFKWSRIIENTGFIVGGSFRVLLLGAACVNVRMGLYNDLTTVGHHIGLLANPLLGTIIAIQLELPIALECLSWVDPTMSIINGSPHVVFAIQDLSY
ncbi:hypothetical protein M9H77_16652 [Catharanthus roseus]|uniref:Uncharacterized protein n=1 Tax=Catharanthus roseus TaxID=4058 RepID=A0ACC0B2C7_CATRO|nr:hypothetical protein M9H77_16652 [Catharanthus roseus]